MCQHFMIRHCYQKKYGYNNIVISVESIYIDGYMELQNITRGK